MSPMVCLVGRAFGYAEGSGHLWVYLNWALGLRSVGCEVLWLEAMDPSGDRRVLMRHTQALRERLAAYGLADVLILAPGPDRCLPPELAAATMPQEAAAEADLILTLGYATRAYIPGDAPAALVDIDPGLLQKWIAGGWMDVGGYDTYFTIGETVGTPEARFPDAGIRWHYTPPCVSLDHWTRRGNPGGGAFTTVSNWTGDEWMEDEEGWYPNDKRDGFLPFLDLPGRVSQQLELALTLGPAHEEDVDDLRRRGWRVRHALEVSSTPEAYQTYIADSLAEFSCAKPSCVRLKNAWVSDRTLCYLASGRPAVVQHTGRSRILPDASGMFRFRTMEEAAAGIERVAADWEHQSHLARELAEEHFDARKVVARVLEVALP
jgi:hypothetical protein